MDHQPGPDRAWDGHALVTVQSRGRPLGVCRPAPAEFPRLHRRPRGPAGALHVPVDSGGAAIPNGSDFGEPLRELIRPKLLKVAAFSAETGAARSGSNRELESKFFTLVTPALHVAE